MIKKITITTIFLGLGLLSASHASADTLGKLVKCSNTKDSLVRLVCYDNVVKSLNSSNSVNLPEVTASAVAESPKVSVNQKPGVMKSDDSFGSEHLIAKNKSKNKGLTQVAFTIKTAEKTLRKKWKVTFENGQVWEQTDSGYIKLSAGNKVELSKGMLGVFYLKKTDQNKKIRVKRQK
jgi:hypothetical protein